MEHGQPDVGQMIDRVVAHFRTRGEDVGVENMLLEREDGTHHSLSSLVHSLALLSSDRWDDAIRAHFEEADATPGLPGTWEDAAGAVRIRVFARSAVAGSETVTWEIDEGLVAALMVGGIDPPIPVEDHTLTLWAIKPEVAFDRALRNTTDHEAVSDRALATEGGGAVTALEGGPFTTAHLLVLDRRWDEAPHGAVVAVPNEGSVLYHRIVDQGALTAIAALSTEASRRHVEGPGPIVPDVFWWRATGLEKLGSGPGADGLDPSGELGGTIASLPPAGDEGGHGWFRRRH
jgi:hypothetical protein